MKIKTKQFIDSFIGIPLVYINLVFAKLMGFLLRRDHSLAKPPDHILFIKLLGFGSVIIASDTIWSIKKKYPAARIHIICSRSIYDGIVSLQLFDTILVIEDRNFSTMILSGFKILFRSWKLKNKWIIDLEVYSKLTSVFALWTCAMNRIGFYFNTVAFRYRLNTHNVYFNTRVNVEENYKHIAELMGIAEVSPFKIPGYEPAVATEKKNTIALNNTCSDLSLERKLKPEQVAALCKWILKHTHYNIALLGAPADYAANKVLIETNFPGEERIQNIAGLYQFREYYDFLYQQCCMMITIDSAPLHIANKLNMPSISIWGPTAPDQMMKSNDRNEIVYLSVPCSPCVHFTDVLPCGGDNFCIKKIDVLEIARKIEKLSLTFASN